MDPIDPLLTGPEAAKMLGVSLTTFYRRTWDGTVPPPVKIGHRLARWPRSEITAVIEKAKAAREGAAA